MGTRPRGGQRQDGGDPVDLRLPHRNLARLLAREPVTPLEDVMLIVSDDRAVVEADLAAGRLVCPRCLVGVLGGWGCSRLREVRTGSGVRRLRPRRGRCRERSCRATHVLLPDLCLGRRRYVVEVIGAALLSAGREGYRRAGERLGVPGETVRDWRQRFGVAGGVDRLALSAVGAGAGRARLIRRPGRGRRWLRPSRRSACARGWRRCGWGDGRRGRGCRR